MGDVPASSRRLAAALIEVGLEDMAPRARAGHWHASGPEPEPRRRLVLELRARAHRTHRRADRDRILQLARRAREGEFDTPLGELVRRPRRETTAERAARSGIILP